MARVILICGKLCSGKSTYAEKLRAETGAVLLSVDEIMLALFGLYAGEKHDEYAEKTKRYLHDKSAELLSAGVDVILDWGFWRRDERAAAKAFYAARGLPCEFHYLDVCEAVWKERIQKRNLAVAAGRLTAYPVDEALAAKFASRFEAPDKDEIDVWITGWRGTIMPKCRPSRPVSNGPVQTSGLFCRKSDRASYLRSNSGL